MAKFEVHNGSFLLDGEPVFIHAGEFHYFRTPKDQWPHRLGLLRAAGFNAVAAYIPWLWHQPTENLMDLDGDSHPMRDLAGFLDLAAVMGLWVIPRPGPYIMAETINEGIPPWVFEKYPEAAFISQDGRVQNVVSYLHPGFLECVRGWYRAVFGVLAPRQVTRGGRILMVQLDNEMGMIQWVRNILDTNPDTLSHFAAHLQTHRPGALPASSPAEMVETLHRAISQPQEGQSAWVVEEYRRFYRQYLRTYSEFLLAEAQANGLETPPVINIHGFGNGGKTFPIGLSQLVDVMRIAGVMSATDVYPIFIGEGNFHQLLLVNEMTKALQNPDQALFSIEFQAGGNNDFSGHQVSMYDLHSRLCISQGMRAINHYLFFDGENDPILSPVRRHDWGHPVRKDGSLRKHYYRYRGLSNILQAYGDSLVSARPETVTTIGFMLDDFMTEVNSPFTQQASNALTHQRDVILFDFIARGLALTHRPFDALDLQRAALDPAKTPLCWALVERQRDAQTQQKWVDYVQNGGQLILVGRMCVEDFNHQPCTLLKDALGIEQIEGGLPFSQGKIAVFSHEEIPVSFMEGYTGTFTEVFARSANGQVVGFIQALGKGRVMVLGAALAANTLDDLDVFEQMALKMGCLPAFKMSEWVDVRISRSETGSFLFLNHYQEDPLETTLEYHQQVLFGGSPIRLPARRGLVLPLDWQVRPGVRVVYSTAEIVAVEQSGDCLTLHTEPRGFFAELTLDGYRCEQPTLAETALDGRIRLQGQNGQIVLWKIRPGLLKA